MTFVWCEWICSHCGNLHRARFNIVVGQRAAYQLRGRLFQKEGVYIEDVAIAQKEKPSKKLRGGSKIYVLWDTPLEKIVKAMKEYMPQYYAVKEDTLKVEVCRD